MAKCDVCGNDYDKAFTVTLAGRTQTFDSFECAIHALAPTAAARSLATGWNRTAPITAAPTAPNARASRALKIGHNECLCYPRP